MKIKEVLNLPTGTEVKANSVCYIVKMESGIKVLHRGGYSVKLTQPLVTTEYELVRKKLNFFEAMRLVDEGKVVSNDRYPIYNYKKINGVPKIKKTDGDYETLSIAYKELEANWYEVIE